MPNPVSPSDIEARWRPLSDQETVVAQARLDDAWELLLDRRATLEADLLAGTVRERTVIRVVADMVLRVLKNPEGYDSETIDDYTYRRNAVISAGVLHVTAEELADITPASKGKRNSVRLVVYGDA